MLRVSLTHGGGNVRVNKKKLFIPFTHGHTQNDRFICLHLHLTTQDKQSIGLNMAH